MKGDLIRVEAEIDGLDAGLAKARAFAQEDLGIPLTTWFRRNYWRRLDAAPTLSCCSRKRLRRGRRRTISSQGCRLYTRTGELGKAEAVLNSRLKMDPKDLVIRSTLASIYLEQKRYDNAIDEYTRITASDRPTQRR